MFRCKECGAEYEEKPDYCDCGNDEFEEVVVGVNIKEQEPVRETKTEDFPQEKVEEKPPVMSAATMNFHNNIEQNSYIPKRTLNVDPISLFIFIICIILSLYVIFFAFNGNDNPAETDTQTKKETVTNKNIPSIDKIWNNAVPVVKKEEPKKEETVENIIKQIIPIPQKKVEQPKPVQKTQPKVTKVPLTKVTPKTTTKTTSNTNTNTKKQTTNTLAQEQAKKAAEEAAAKQKAEQERKAAEAAQLKKLQAEQAKKAEAEKARQAAAAKQELVTYKAQLRNTIGRKIDFTRVIGDGSCTVAFKVDANGRLVNRSFAKQSSNNTLNDAVYAAVMATPTFNPPPDAYNNETLNLNIKFSNGNFEISLP